MICVLCGKPLVLVGTVSPIWLHAPSYTGPRIARSTFRPVVEAA